MSRLDMLQWEVINSLPITPEGVSDGMWAIALFALLILVFVLDRNRNTPRNPPRYPPHYPPHYPPF